ncbi:type II toxin-antitoxin system VapC family toxin [Patescibacteria group bacterium]|nr:type II toxin-antitoxin system VapC family toxin [Patescibacteria group bacterium]
MKDILVDTDLLVYAINDSNELYNKKSRDFINDNVEYLVISDQNINEALRILTHPVFKKRLTVTKALNAVKKITDECTQIVPNISTRDTFYKLVKKYCIDSNRIYDAYLVATMLTNGVHLIATFDKKGFSCFDEVQIMEL